MFLATGQFASEIGRQTIRRYKFVQFFQIIGSVEMYLQERIEIIALRRIRYADLTEPAIYHIQQILLHKRPHQ